MNTKDRAVADLRSVIAEKHGLTPAQATQLQGNTREEIEDSAQFLAYVGPGGGKKASIFDRIRQEQAEKAAERTGSALSLEERLRKAGSI